MKKPIQIGLKWLMVSCLAVGAIVGYVGMQVRKANDLQRAGQKIEDYLALHAKPGTYHVDWLDCNVRIRDPLFGDEELRGLKIQLSEFPHKIWIDVRGTSITKRGILALQDVQNIAQVKACSTCLSPEEADALDGRLHGVVDVTVCDPSRTWSLWDNY